MSRFSPGCPDRVGGILNCRVGTRGGQRPGPTTLDGFSDPGRIPSRSLKNVSETQNYPVETFPLTAGQIGPIPLKRLDPDLPMPQRAHRGDAGVDLYAAEDLLLEPGQRGLVGTGVALALPLGTVGLVHPRSGLAARHGLSIVNAPGTVDADYRGEIKVNLINLDPVEKVEISRGMRIAQLLIQRVELVDFLEVEDLDETERGTGGHGSTGLN